MSCQCGLMAWSRQGFLASVRQRIHELAMQGIFGWALGPITSWNRGTEQKKKSELCGEIVISSSATSGRRRSDMMNPNKVSDLVKGTGQSMRMSGLCVGNGRTAGHAYAFRSASAPNGKG